MVDFTPDCENCAALCCLALAIDKGEAFSFDKPAGIACVHLLPSYRCNIHAELSARGCDGCVQYSCEGAGQRVVHELFAGQSWQDEPALKRPMIEAFHSLRLVHKYLVLLDLAKGLELDAAQARARLEFRARLDPAEGWHPESLQAFARAGFVGEIEAFFKGLKSAAQSWRNRQE